MKANPQDLDEMLYKAVLDTFSLLHGRYPDLVESMQRDIYNRGSFLASLDELLRATGTDDFQKVLTGLRVHYHE